MFFDIKVDRVWLVSFFSKVYIFLGVLRRDKIFFLILDFILIVL